MISIYCATQHQCICVYWRCHEYSDTLLGPRARRIAVIGSGKVGGVLEATENPAFADSTSRHAARLQPSSESSPRSSACPETLLREHPADSDGAPSNCAAKSIPRNAQTILRTQSASRFLLGTPRGNRRTRIGKPRRCLQGLAVPGAAFRRCRRPINWTRSTLHSASWSPAILRSKAPPNPTACGSAAETPDSRD